jgi:hypothetical protein
MKRPAAIHIGVGLDRETLDAFIEAAPLELAMQVDIVIVLPHTVKR